MIKKFAIEIYLQYSFLCYCIFWTKQKTFNTHIYLFYIKYKQPTGTPKVTLQCAITSPPHYYEVEKFGMIIELWVGDALSNR